jgi:hypothetical protein
MKIVLIVKGGPAAIDPNVNYAGAADNSIMETAHF